MSEKKYRFENIKAIIGLGNPGAKYRKTRHNIGFRVLDAFVEKFGVSWNDSDSMSHTSVMITSFDADGFSVPRVVHFVKPLTFMNSSGRVIPFLQKKGIKGDEILVVHDELEKKFGKMSIKFGGSARGHNGLRSIESVIGKDYWRLRFGIDRPEDKNQVSNYVLARFSADEEAALEGLIEKAGALIESR